MQTIHAEQLTWQENALPHRTGRIAFKPLLTGREQTSDNFALILAEESADFYSPRHCHPWDQIRLCLSGEVPVAPGLGLADGEVGYFPEGVLYGPQDGTVDRLVLVLQFGGASGLGYLSEQQLARGRRELQDLGRFERGVFHRNDGDGSESKDGYAAVWEQVTGTAMSLPAPRFKGPVLMDPAGFAWRDVAPGIQKKSLGMVTERGVEIGFVTIQPDTHYPVVNSGDTQRIIFVTQGFGVCDAGDYEPHTAISLAPGEELTFKASRPTEIFCVVLPTIAESL